MNGLKALEGNRYFDGLRDDQKRFALHCLRSWGVKEGAFVLTRIIRKAVRVAKERRP